MDEATEKLAEQYAADAADAADVSTGRQLVRTLLAEVRRLRVLPVLASCADCGHMYTPGPPSTPLADQCGLADRDLPDEDVIPAWCPLRGAP